MTATSNLIPTATAAGQAQSSATGRAAAQRGRIGLVVLGSLAAGLAAAALLVVAPFGPATQSASTGSVLCGLAVGWAALAVLSERLTDQPQRWAFAPAALMGLGGVLLVLLGSTIQPVLSWIWPPVTLALSIWMIVRSRRSLRGSRSRWVLSAVSALLALASVGGGYQTVGEAVDAQAHPMPGQLVSVGDHSLHLHCTGTGGPTVVMEAGGGETSAVLERIASDVAGDTRVCVYDRAGRGWSETAQTAPHGAQIAIDLHTLLQRAQVPGPFVLAGHSFGGLYVQNFAERYPSEVAGMVLIDSTAPDAAAPDSTPRPYVVNRLFALVSASAQLGIGHVFGATARDVGSTIDEYADAGDAAKLAASFTDFSDKPLVVLTARLGHDAAWFAAQDRMAGLSTNSVHRVVDDASHEALVTEPHGAAATADAILDVVSAVRSGEPLVT